MGGKFTADLGYIRYNYPGANANLMLDFNEFGLVLGYDFGPSRSARSPLQPRLLRQLRHRLVQVGAGHRAAALHQLQLFGDPVVAKLFGTIGSQYVERNVNYGIPNNDYWDWQLGTTVTVYGVDLTVAYVGTNIDYNGCLATYNCEDRVIFTVSKTF